MVPFEFRIVLTRLYGNVIAKIKTIEGCSEEIKCNIGVKKICLLSPTLFSIYIEKLEECLEATGCEGPKLVGIVITFLLYANNIVLLSKSSDDLEK